MGFDDRDAGRADEHGAVLSADAVRLSLRVSPRHTSLGTLGHVRVIMSLRKGPRFLMGTGAFVFLSGVKGLCRTPS